MTSGKTSRRRPIVWRWVMPILKTSEKTFFLSSGPARKACTRGMGGGGGRRSERGAPLRPGPLGVMRNRLSPF